MMSSSAMSAAIRAKKKKMTEGMVASPETEAPEPMAEETAPSDQPMVAAPSPMVDDDAKKKKQEKIRQTLMKMGR